MELGNDSVDYVASIEFDITVKGSIIYLQVVLLDEWFRRFGKA